MPLAGGVALRSARGRHAACAANPLRASAVGLFVLVSCLLLCPSSAIKVKIAGQHEECFKESMAAGEDMTGAPPLRGAPFGSPSLKSNRQRPAPLGRSLLPPLPSPSLPPLLRLQASSCLLTPTADRSSTGMSRSPC